MSEMSPVNERSAVTAPPTPTSCRVPSIVTATDDGSWPKHAADLERVINELIAEHGRGAGELDMESPLKLTIDASHRQAYCVDGKVADARLYLDEPGKDLQRLDALLFELYQPALKKACG